MILRKLTLKQGLHWAPKKHQQCRVNVLHCLKELSEKVKELGEKIFLGDTAHQSLPPRGKDSSGSWWQALHTRFSSPGRMRGKSGWRNQGECKHCQCDPGREVSQTSPPQYLHHMISSWCPLESKALVRVSVPTHSACLPIVQRAIFNLHHSYKDDDDSGIYLIIILTPTAAFFDYIRNVWYVVPTPHGYVLLFTGSETF